MRCPYCSHEETQVAETRESDEGDVIRRRRRCLKCDKRFTTYERPEIALPSVVKKDGSRADFDPDNDGSPVFAAWAGANVAGAGSSVGRVAADASHQARTLIEGAQEKLHDVQEAVSKRLPWKSHD